MPYPLTYVELFAGAGGLSLGLETAGWQCVAHAEWDAFPRRVLKHRWPDVPLFGDVAQIDGTQFKGVTLLTGGSPCQDLSIAGKRAGMSDGTRSSLFFEQIRLWHECEAPFILWENVIGAFSSQQGRDFAAVLSAIVGRAVPVPADGWRRGGVASGPAGIAAWRVLDAQYFGVPQRRRRVFVLGTRDTRVDPAEVLSLAESLSGHLASSGQARENVATDAGRSLADSDDGDGDRVPFVYEWHGLDGRAKELTVARTLNIRNQEGREHHVVVMRNREGKPGGGKGPLLAKGKSLTLGTSNDQVVFAMASGQANAEVVRDGSPSLTLLHEQPIAFTSYDAPRRLTPLECERLMGWPDNWTDVPDEKGKPATDTARYKACGNGVASPVAAWIGFRLRAALEGYFPNHYEK